MKNIFLQLISRNFIALSKCYSKQKYYEQLPLLVKMEEQAEDFSSHLKQPRNWTEYIKQGLSRHWIADK